ncbi:MAG: hypothetical protein ACJAWW_002557 [Sulfurimonas sp.]
MKLILSLLIILGLASCGYKPSSKFARDVMGEKISTSIVISAKDPENTVIIKDAVDEAVIKIFHASLCDKASSDTHLTISIKSTSYTATVYDEDGYVTGYKMTVSLGIKRMHSGVSKDYTVSGTYDFTVDADASVTDSERFDAISSASAKAIKSFVAVVSAEGARAQHQK